MAGLRNKRSGKLKLGVFGGTFNPIHYGHLIAAEEVREKLSLDKIIFVPSGNPPLKNKELADAVHRYKMVRLATFKNRFFTVSDIEYKKKNKSYSVNTLKELHSLYAGAALNFMLGIDAFLDIPNWWQADRLISLTDFIITSRPLFRFVDLLNSPYLNNANKNTLQRLDDAELDSYKIELTTGRKITMLRLTPIGISATSIRRLIKEGEGIKYLLPEEVESYIISNKLYKIKN